MSVLHQRFKYWAVAQICFDRLTQLCWLKYWALAQIRFDASVQLCWFKYWALAQICFDRSVQLCWLKYWTLAQIRFDRSAQLCWYKYWAVSALGKPWATSLSIGESRAPLAPCLRREEENFRFKIKPGLRWRGWPRERDCVLEQQERKANPVQRERSLVSHRRVSIFNAL